MAIDPNIKQKAADIRTKVFGSEVRESLASGLEGMSEDVESIKGRQGNVESQFQNVIDETTGKDVISAPELIAARNGKSNLKTRLDEEHAQVTAQLQQTEQSLTAQLAETVDKQKWVDPITDFGCVGDGIVDDTENLQRAFDSLSDNDVIFLNHIYLTTKTITIGRNIQMFGEGTIIADHDNTGVLLKAVGKTHFTNLNMRISVTRKEFNDLPTAIGIEVINSVTGTIFFGKMLNHSIGVLFRGDAYGNTYNKYHFTDLTDCKVGIELRTNNGGWITENEFNGGAFGSHIMKDPLRLRQHVLISGAGISMISSNMFVKQSYEGHHPVGVEITPEASHNLFVNCRFEMYHADYFVKIADLATKSTTFLNCFNLPSGLAAGKVEDGGLYTRISGGGGNIGTIEYVDKNVYEYVAPGKPYVRDYTNIKRVSIGGRATKTIEPLDGVLTIDLDESDHFSVRLLPGVEITSIVYKNTLSVGEIRTISFLQSADGNIITGFPFKFLGSNATEPESRPYGRDVYVFMHAFATTNQEFAVLSQYKA